jgi:hypothetical protein
MEQNLSSISDGSFVIILCMGFLLLVLPRRYALVPLLISGCYMTLGQVLIVGGLNFYVFRIIILFGVFRIFIKKEIFSVKLNSIDKILIAWLFASCILYPVFGEFNVALSERLGRMYNTLGTYFFVRALIRNLDDILFTVKLFAIVVIPLGILFTIEYATGRNPFAFLGGVALIPEIRNGRLRCQGPFMHSILAGTFGATSFPLFVGFWAQTTGKSFLTTAAIAATTAIVIFSAASGPILTYLAVIVALISWKFQPHIKMIRWGIVALLLLLHAYMKAPVWFLISRVGDLLGGGGYYRSALIDAAISHFDEWWLVGTGYTAHWMPTGLVIDPNAVDMVNFYVAQGVNGGLLALILFILLIIKCFESVGLATRNGIQYTVQQRFMIWCLGCAVIGHVTAFLSVSYFDQIIIFWYLVVAFIAALKDIDNLVSVHP